VNIRGVFIFLFTCCFLVSFVQAQEHEHEHSRNEIGFSGGLLYSFGHQEWGGGVHLHYFRTLGLHSKWSLGGAFEFARVDGSHYNAGVGAKYQLFNRMSIGALPGVTFLSHNPTDANDAHEKRKALFTIHFELVCDIFQWEKFHLGPVFEYSWKKSDAHSMVGIHAAFCF
jgi:hypothetical protein